MTLAGSDAVLGSALASAAASVDAAGIASWNALATVLVPWVVANVTVQPTGGTPLVATGAAIAGTGALLVGGSSSALGSSLAAAAGSVDAAGVTAWQALAAAVCTWLATGTVVPAGLIGYVGAGAAPVTGAGALAFASPPALAGAVGATDAAGITAWTAIGSALQAHLTSSAVVSPLPAMANPGAGGPVTGLGSIL